MLQVALTRLIQYRYGTQSRIGFAVRSSITGFSYGNHSIGFGSAYDG